MDSVVIQSGLAARVSTPAGYVMAAAHVASTASGPLFIAVARPNGTTPNRRTMAVRLGAERSRLIEALSQGQARRALGTENAGDVLVALHVSAGQG